MKCSLSILVALLAGVFVPPWSAHARTAETDMISEEVYEHRHPTVVPALLDLARLTLDPDDDTRNELLRAQNRWTDLNRELDRKYPGKGGRSELPAVQAALPPNAALIGWHETVGADGRRSHWAYVVRSKGDVRWELLGNDSATVPRTLESPTHELREKLTVSGSWPFRVTDTTEVDALGRALWKDWIQPVLPHLGGVEHLIVVPSGSMLGVPVEALRDEADRYITDRFTITYSPSAAVYAWLAENPRSRARSGKALLVGDPPFTEEHRSSMELEADGSIERARLRSGEKVTAEAIDHAQIRSALSGDEQALGSLPRLPRSRDEVALVARSFEDPRILLGLEASEQNLASMARSGELGSFETIHLATHALMDGETPERSALVLSRAELPDPMDALVEGRRVIDGLVTATEIVREWKLNADLVTLSGCQGGLGRVAHGEGYIGFSHAFLRAGARSLLVSLWAVDDLAAALLMGRFYENLNGNYPRDRGFGSSARMGKADALHEAKRFLREMRDDAGELPFRHPAYWSAFVLLGDPE